MRWTLAIAVVLGSVWGILGTDVQATLGIVKPDCVDGGHFDSIKNQVRASGFTIEAEKQIRLSSAEAEEFYAEHSGRGFFRDLIGFMTSGPVWVLKLVKKNAVSEWRSLIGPTDALQARASHPESIRAKFGSDVQRNCVHGSDSGSSAARELAFFLGSDSTGKNQASHNFLLFQLVMIQNKLTDIQSFDDRSKLCALSCSRKGPFRLFGWIGRDSSESQEIVLGTDYRDKH